MATQAAPRQHTSQHERTPVNRTRNGHDTAHAKASRKPPSKNNGNHQPSRFTQFAQKTAQLAGRPGTFVLAAAVIVVWGLSGPLFDYSDTWQLVINTGTTIVTFLMVFLIQHTQNRDTLALQVKLDELIIKLRAAGNEVAGAEDLCDEDLEKLHDTYRKRAAAAQSALEERRGAR